MANRNMTNAQSCGIEDKIVRFRFTPSGTGTALPVQSTGSSYVTVTQTATGVFLATFADSWPGIASMVGSVQVSTVADFTVQFGNYDATLKTLVIRTMTGAAAAGIPTSANNSVSVEIIFYNTSVPNQ